MTNIWQEVSAGGMRSAVTTVQNIQICVFRARDERGMMGLVLNEDSSEIFDVHRPPILWIGDEEPDDWGEARAFNELLNSLDKNSSPSYVAEDRITSEVIWHGNRNEGVLRVIQNLLVCRRGRLRVFLKPYETRDYVFSLEGAGPIIRAVMGL